MPFTVQESTMSVSIGSAAPQITAFFDRSNRSSRGGTGDFGPIARGDDSVGTGASAGSTTDKSSEIRQRGIGHGGGATIQRLDPQTLHALTEVAPQADAAPSPQQQSPTDTGTTAGSASDTDAPGKRVAIDFIHIELPNGVKFELRHTPGAGETGDQALQSLVKAAEELSKELGGIAAPAKHEDAKTHSDNGPMSAYAKQLSAYATRLADEGTMVTA
jgi:hypothetical protein